MEKKADIKDSQEKMEMKAGERTPDITEVIYNAKKKIGANIGKIQKGLNLTNPQFYDLLFGKGTIKENKDKSTEISRIKRGDLTIATVITVIVKTKTPPAELFTEIDEKNIDMEPTAYDVCRMFYNILASGRFDIEGTSKLQKEGAVWSFEKEKKERNLDNYYPKKFRDYPQPIYIRIMPRYFWKTGENGGEGGLAEYTETEEIFQFITNALELYSSNLPEINRVHYIHSELEKISQKSIDKEDYTYVGDYWFDYMFS